MKRHTSLALLLILHLLATITLGQTPSAQTPSTSPRQQGAPADDEVVRITTNLVQVDAIVTGKGGRQVTDLKPEDFEISEDNRPQPITNFSYVQLAPAEAAPPPSSPSIADRTAPPAPPVRLRPEQVRRTIALVVDDLSLSFTSTHYVKDALKKFIERQMQPGDLVAIIRTGGGMGALQQFTSDKRQLYAAIERVRWNPTGTGGIAAFSPMQRTADLPSAANDRTARNPVQEFDDFREDIFSIGTLGALNYIVRGLRDLPGRKSVLLISDGLTIFSPRNMEHGDRVITALHQLTDLANRASVVISTMDARGLVAPMLSAEDDTSEMTPDQVEESLSNRRQDFFESQSGLIYLARQTGGVAIHDQNDLSKGIQRVLDDQKGYYLIGYRPDKSTFDPATGRRLFHKLTIKVKRPGLSVRYRSGFYGLTDEQAKPVRRTVVEQLIGALTSPFNSGGVNLRLTSLFSNDAHQGSFMRSMLHINSRDLTFTDLPGGSHRTTFDLLALTFGDNGIVVDQLGRSHTLTVPDDHYQRLLQNGFDYYLTVPVKKAGAYQLRVALRDSSSQKVGSASQFIEVPNINKKRLLLSGLLLQGVNPEAVKPKPDGKTGGASVSTPGATKDDDTASNGVDPQSGPAVRRIRIGMLLQYDFFIFNATIDKATGRPQLITQVRLFRDGQQVYAGKQLPYNAEKQTDLRRLLAGGVLQLGTGTDPGEYILQVVVTDTLAKGKYTTTSQWIDLEIVK